MIVFVFICVTDRLDSLLKAVYHERWREFPEYATYSGYHGYDDALESFTMAAFDRRKVRCYSGSDVTMLSSTTFCDCFVVYDFL